MAANARTISRDCGTVITAILLLIAPPAMTASAQPTTPSTPGPQKILVHVTAGPNEPTRAALAFAVANAALDDGHQVSMFLAGDGVQLIREAVLDNLTGLGTGKLRELYDAVVAKGGRIYLSGGSSQARGITAAELEGKPAEFAGPPQLVRLSLAHDRTFVY